MFFNAFIIRGLCVEALKFLSTSQKTDTRLNPTICCLLLEHNNFLGFLDVPSCFGDGCILSIIFIVPPSINYFSCPRGIQTSPWHFRDATKHWIKESICIRATQMLQSQRQNKTGKHTARTEMYVPHGICASVISRSLKPPPNYSIGKEGRQWTPRKWVLKIPA